MTPAQQRRIERLPGDWHYQATTRGWHTFTCVGHLDSTVMARVMKILDGKRWTVEISVVDRRRLYVAVR